MGNSNSSTNKPNTGVKDSRKFVCILYGGKNKTHTKNTKAFRDALQADPAGQNLNMLKPVDVSHPGFCAEKYLKQRPQQNLILLSVDKDGEALLQKTINEPWIVDHGLPRVLSASFGMVKPQDMVPVLNQRQPGTDQKDFCFKFSDTSCLDANDFSNSPVLQELITSLMASPEI